QSPTMPAGHTITFSRLPLDRCLFTGCSTAMIWCSAEIGARPDGLNAKVSNESAPHGPRLHAPSRARQDSVWGQRQRVNRNNTALSTERRPPVIPSEARACPEPAEGNLALKIRHARKFLLPAVPRNNIRDEFLSTLLKGFE